MSIVRTLSCPSCSGEFDHFFMKSDDPYPRFCSLCGFDTQAPVGKGRRRKKLAAMPSAPRIEGSGARKNVDGYYRAVEEGGEHRANVAESMGLSSEDARTLKVTDMRDNMREGDIAEKPVVNDVTMAMDRINQIRPGSVGFQANGAQYSGEVQGGPFPNAGARTMQGLRRAHSGGGFTTSSLPALETLQPGYKARA